MHPELHTIEIGHRVIVSRKNNGNSLEWRDSMFENWSLKAAVLIFFGVFTVTFSLTTPAAALLDREALLKYRNKT